MIKKKTTTVKKHTTKHHVSHHHTKREHDGDWSVLGFDITKKKRRRSSKSLGTRKSHVVRMGRNKKTGDFEIKLFTTKREITHRRKAKRKQVEED